MQSGQNRGKSSQKMCTLHGSAIKDEKDWYFSPSNKVLMANQMIQQRRDKRQWT